VILGGDVAVCCLFTFVGALHGNLYNSTAFLFFLECVCLMIYWQNVRASFLCLSSSALILVFLCMCIIVHFILSK